MKSSTLWKVHQKWQKMKKSLVQFAFNPLLKANAKTRLMTFVKTRSITSVGVGVGAATE